jgi:hypothetical protein
MNYQMALSYLENGFSLIHMHYKSSVPSNSLLRLNDCSSAKRWQDFEMRYGFGTKHRHR